MGGTPAFGEAISQQRDRPFLVAERTVAREGRRNPNWESLRVLAGSGLRCGRGVERRWRERKHGGGDERDLALQHDAEQRVPQARERAQLAVEVGEQAGSGPRGAPLSLPTRAEQRVGGQRGRVGGGGGSEWKKS